MSFNLFSNPIGRHEKRYFIYKEIKLIETEVTCPNWHRECYKENLNSMFPFPGPVQVIVYFK